MDLSNLTSKELEELLAKKRQEEREAGIRKREAYEGIKAEMICGMKHKVSTVCIEVQGLHKFCQDELGAFRDVMLEYGQLKRGNAQMSFTVQDDNFKIEVKSNKVKKFDERADVAAARLIEFLQNWIQGKEDGADNPMYQLAITLLERNKNGDLDYTTLGYGGNWNRVSTACEAESQSSHAHTRQVDICLPLRIPLPGNDPDPDLPHGWHLLFLL